MRSLSFAAFIILFAINFALGQSPHGDNLKNDCSDCHQSTSWKIDLKKIGFDHSQTNFTLTGQHQNIDCRSCHKSLVFSEVNNNCFSCHKDIHQNTVGENCSRCHSTDAWVVKDILLLHQSGRFPLIGAHKTADCKQCHIGFSELKFEQLDVECFTCHANEYRNTQNPNHLQAGFSVNCQECHNLNALRWSSISVNHDFFPLVGGHSLPNCFACHKQGQGFTGLSRQCYSCHQSNYQSTQNPNHTAAGFNTSCESCHNVYGWRPATFDHDNQFFPIYSGKHKGKWNDCSDCHTVPTNYSIFSCLNCHEHNKTSMDSKHQSVRNYLYESRACLNCHPDGKHRNLFQPRINIDQ